MSRLHLSHWKQINPFLYIIWVVALFTATFANSEQTLYEKQETASLLEDKAIGFLNELSTRRRVTTLFPNFQTSQHGVQEKFVNTSKGNLTFLIRDLVVVESMPIVMGRVYDSAIQGGADFGPGWKLSVREEVRRDGNTLTFLDASNSEYLLKIRQNTIVPTQRTLNPISEGSLTWHSSLDEHRLILRSSQLVREFELIGDRYRLVEISNGNGSILLEYRDELIDRIVSGKSEISIKRDSNRRIESITDNHGRTVRYIYNDDGSLSQVVDRSDATWAFSYNPGLPGLLQEIVDPRGETMLQTSFSKDRRAAWVQVLDQEANFEYQNSSTVVVDKLNRKTIFEQESNGLTSGIVNPAGDATRVLFDDEFRPVVLVRNGTKIARISYDRQGRMQTVSTESGTTRYDNGKHGVVAAFGGAHAGRYEYDSDGRLVKAGDKFGEREYQYMQTEQKFVFGNQDNRLELQVNEIGLVTRIVQNRRYPTQLSYDGMGRVISITSPNFPNISYTYDERGLRETMQYGRIFNSQLSYDEVGNLRKLSLSNSEGKTSTQEYTLDANNRVMRINSDNGDVNTEIMFHYDELGRIRTANTNNRTMRVQYDILDRAELVELDGEPVVMRSYHHNEPDLIASRDRVTARVTTTGHVSQVFGSVNSIMYTRPSPTTFGLIGYNSELKSFEVHEDAMVPDIVFLSSVQSRQIPLDGSQIRGGPLQFDKPSNALFLPGEFLSVNCQVCPGLLLAVTLSIIQFSEGPNTPVRIRADLWGVCSSLGGNGEGQYTDEAWIHNVDFGDGHSTTITSSLNSIVLERTYTVAGVYRVTDTVECSSCSLFATRTKSRLVVVPGPCTASVEKIDESAILYGQSIPPNPWEEALSINCIGTSIWPTHKANSNPANFPPWPDRNAADPCHVEVAFGGSIVAGLHSHPVFTNPRQMNAGKGCNGIKNHTQSSMNTFNMNARIFSQADKDWVDKEAKLPLYLVYGRNRFMRVLNLDKSVENLPR